MDYFYLNDVKAAVKASSEEWKAQELKIADHALNNSFIFISHYEMERCTKEVHFDNKIDWNYVPFGDNEWNYAFNRHTFLLSLAHAFAITNDNKYKDGFIRLFLDWKSNAKFNENNKKLSWRSLEAGIRVENYLRSIEIFSLTSPLPEEVLKAFEETLKEHIKYLLETHNDFHRLSNWGVLQDHGLFLASLYLNDTSSLLTSIERLREEFSFQCDSDGLHWEQSPMYQAEVLHAGLDVLLVAMRNGITLPISLIDAVHKMAIGLAKISRPDGKLYLFGDSDELSVKDLFITASILFSDSKLSYYGKEERSEEVLWQFPLSEEIPKAIKDEETLHFLEFSGNVVITLNEDLALRFHAGAVGSGHGHLDQLHFDLFLNGEVLLTDSGRYTYVDNEDRRYFKSAKAHNTILINGKEYSEQKDSWVASPLGEAFGLKAIKRGNYYYTEASHLGYMSEGVLLRRALLLIDSKVLLVADYIYSDSKEVSSETYYHLDSLSTLDLNGNCVHCAKNKASLTIFFPDENISIQKGMISKHYNEKEANSVLVHKREGAGVKLTVITLGSEDALVKNLPVIKPLTNTLLPSNIATGLEIIVGSDCYKVALVAKETLDNGLLLRVGGDDFHSHLYVKKNDEEGVNILE